MKSSGLDQELAVELACAPFREIGNSLLPESWPAAWAAWHIKESRSSLDNMLALYRHKIEVSVFFLNPLRRVKTYLVLQ